MRTITRIIPILLLGAGLAAPATAQQPNTMDVNPETQTHTTGTSAQFTVTTVPPTQGINIDFEIEAGPNDLDGGFKPASGLWDFTCTTNATGVCMAPFDGLNAGTDTVRAWVDADKVNSTVEADMGEGALEAQTPGDQDEPDRTDVVTMTWETPGQAPPKLDTEPETGSAPPGGTIRLTSTVTRGGATVQNTIVDFLIESGTGAGPGSHKECTTGSDGTCFVDFTGPAEESTNRVRTWIEEDDNDVPNEADLAEQQPDQDNDATDVVELRWAPERLVLNLTPEQGLSPPGAPHTIDVELKNNFDVAQQGRIVAVLVRTGPNVESVQTCQTGVDGKCSVTFPGAQSGTDEYLGWVDANNNQLAEATEADLAEGRNETTTPGTASEPDRTDVVQNEWIDTLIDVQPEDGTETTGQERVLTASVKTSGGQPQSGQDVNFEIESGPNADYNENPDLADLSCTTATDGTCTVRYTGTSDTGTDTIRAWLDRDKNKGVPGEADPTEGLTEGSQAGRDPEPDVTDVVEVTWQAPPPPGCEGTDQDDLIIGSDGDDICIGRAGNDTIRGLGGNDVLRGGAGNDVLSLGVGNDTANGGSGTDSLKGGPGDDTLKGGPSNGDTATGGSGDDACKAEQEKSCER